MVGHTPRVEYFSVCVFVCMRVCQRDSVSEENEEFNGQKDYVS